MNISAGNIKHAAGIFVPFGRFGSLQTVLGRSFPKSYDFPHAHLHFGAILRGNFVDAFNCAALANNTFMPLMTVLFPRNRSFDRSLHSNGICSRSRVANGYKSREKARLGVPMTSIPHSRNENALTNWLGYYKSSWKKERLTARKVLH